MPIEKNAITEKFSHYRRVTVMGLGSFGGGAGAAKFLARCGCEVTVTDLRDAKTLEKSLSMLAGLPIRFVLGEHRMDDFIGADLVVVNPAVKFNNEFITQIIVRKIPLQTEIGIALSLHTGVIFAVTGTNGKSTTTALIGSLLRENNPRALLGGNIGGSLLETFYNEPSALELPLALELSSFQLYYLQLSNPNFAPRVTALTNLSPNHLDWHQTVEHYYDSKRNLLNAQTADDFVVLNFGDKNLRAWAKNCAASVIAVDYVDPATASACFLRGDEIIFRSAGGEQKLFAKTDLSLPGEHNLLNAMQASAAFYAVERSGKMLRSALRKFSGLPHRLQLVATRGRQDFYNDSIATTPESAICALRSFDRKIVLIAGGYDKGSDFTELAQTIIKRAAAVVLIGVTADKIEKLIRNQAPQFPLIRADDLRSAVAAASAASPADGVILLSPACASYDMFKNFEERGERFGEYARALAAREKS